MSTSPYHELRRKTSWWAWLFPAPRAKPVVAVNSKEHEFFERTGILYSGGDGASVLMSIF